MRWLPLLLLLSACGPTGSTDDDDDATTPEPVHELTVGTWELTLTELREDSCELVGDVAAGASLGTTELTVDGDAIVFVDSDDQTFDCTRDGNALSCTGRKWTNEVPVFPDATIVRQGTRSGTITGPAAITLDNVNTDTCEGADCAAHAAAVGLTYPCVFSFGASAAPE